MMVNEAKELAARPENMNTFQNWSKSNENVILLKIAYFIFFLIFFQN